MNISRIIRSIAKGGNDIGKKDCPLVDEHYIFCNLFLTI